MSAMRNLSVFLNMNLVTGLVLGLVSTFFSAEALAQSQSFSSHGFAVTVSPIASYQYNRKDIPTPHSHFMFMYGARATVGHPKLSGEAEYQKGSDVEVFPVDSLTVKEEKEQIKLGLRSRQPLGKFLEWNVHGGGQATRGKREEIRTTGTTSTIQAFKLAPYVGGGLGLHFSSFLGLVFDFTAVLPNYKKPFELEFQSTMALKIEIGTK